MKLRKATEFDGQYRDITFLIKKLEAFDYSGNKFSWAHYIYINLDKQLSNKSIADQLWLAPEYSDKNIVFYNYYVPCINNIEFHGGCTYYEKISSIDDKGRRIKIGCDYQHSWDEGKNYDLNYIKNEVQKTIDSFIENVSPVLKWCNGCGVMYKDVSKNGCGKCEYSHDKY